MTQESKTEIDDVVDDLILKQKELDEQTRIMAEEIVEAQNPKTLQEAKIFARHWIETAAQHARNEEYWRNRAEAAEGKLLVQVTHTGVEELRIAISGAGDEDGQPGPTSPSVEVVPPTGDVG